MGNGASEGQPHGSCRVGSEGRRQPAPLGLPACPLFFLSNARTQAAGTTGPAERAGEAGWGPLRRPGGEALQGTPPAVHAAGCSHSGPCTFARRRQQTWGRGLSSPPWSCFLCCAPFGFDTPTFFIAKAIATTSTLPLPSILIKRQHHVLVTCYHGVMATRSPVVYRVHRAHHRHRHQAPLPPSPPPPPSPVLLFLHGHGWPREGDVGADGQPCPRDSRLCRESPGGWTRTVRRSEGSAITHSDARALGDARGVRSWTTGAHARFGACRAHVPATRGCAAPSLAGAWVPSALPSQGHLPALRQLVPGAAAVHAPALSARRNAPLKHRGRLGSGRSSFWSPCPTLGHGTSVGTRYGVVTGHPCLYVHVWGQHGRVCELRTLARLRALLSLPSLFLKS